MPSRSRTLLSIAAVLSASTFAAPATAAPTEPGGLTNPLFAATTCTNCHTFGNIEPHENDPLYAPWITWQGSMMANAARDPVFWAGVAIASQDEPGGTIDCVRCHAPRAFLEGRGDAIAMDELQQDDLAGVECDLCHRTMEDAGVPAGNAQYTVDDTLVNGVVPRRGQFAYEDGVGQPPHPFIQDPYTGSSRMCGTCHDVTTPRERVDDAGVGMGVDFNEQRTYSEWLGSSFAQPGDDFRSCQDCHMPEVTDMPGCMENANAGNVHATGSRRHDLLGANRFMLGLLQGLYGSAGTNEVDDFFYETSIANTDAFLATAATLELTAPGEVDLGAGLDGVEVVVTNQTGHKLPTGYSEGRVMWIEVVARYGEDIVWSSGLWTQGTGYEEDAQLRTYRAVAEDYADGAVFHLLRNNHWVEDTRIPPAGLLPNIETDPVGDRYTLQGDGTWPSFDAVQYAFAGNTEIVDATPADSEDDVLTLETRLMYVINTPDYVQFLSDENTINDAGDEVLTLFEDAGGAVPVVLATQTVEIPIVGFGASAESSSSGGSSSTTTPSDTSNGEATTVTTTTADTSGDSGTSTSGTNEDTPADGCSCVTSPSPGAWWAFGVIALARRRRRR
jgi:MYXO-CTERM domain-containing protein